MPEIIELVGGPCDGEITTPSLGGIREYNIPIARPLVWAEYIPTPEEMVHHDIGVYRRRGQSNLFDWQGCKDA